MERNMSDEELLKEAKKKPSIITGAIVESNEKGPEFKDAAKVQTPQEIGKEQGEISE